MPVDSSLLRAIVLDYDLSNASELGTLRDQLDVLRASAVAEDASAFDASGTGGFHPDDVPASTSEAEANSIVTGTTMMSLDSTSGSSSPPEADGATMLAYADLSSDAKLAMLKDLVPTWRPRAVEVALKKSDDDIGRATDVLLNQVFFDESFVDGDGEAPIRTRGVDAFSEDSTYSTKRGRTKKNKKKFRSLDNEFERSSSAPAPAPAHSANKWQSASEDISFIASRVHMSNTYVSSIYHKNGASRRNTIKALIEDYVRTEKHGYDIQVTAYASDLVEEFPSLSKNDCEALIRLTKQSTASAHELAKVLAYTSHPAGPLAEDLIPQYAPVKLSSDVTPSSTRTASPSTNTPGDSRAILVARGAAFENASRYYRRGKSDKLMGGATAYYSSLGRDLSSSLASASAAEADALVSSQSTSAVVDLHGVTVREAVRIACQRAEGWGEGLGERRIPGGGRDIGVGVLRGIPRSHSDSIRCNSNFPASI